MKVIASGKFRKKKNMENKQFIEKQKRKLCVFWMIVALEDY